MEQVLKKEKQIQAKPIMKWACGDSGKVYKFVCDAGQYGHNYNVYYYL